MSNAKNCSHRPVTGYPSSAANAVYPSHPPPAPETSYPESNSSSCLSRVVASVIGLVIVFLTAVFIGWLILRPQPPKFRVDSFSISNFTVSDNSLVSFTSEIRLTALNHKNKMTLIFDHPIRASLFYRSEPDALSNRTVWPTEGPLTVNFAVVSRKVADAINGDRAKKSGKVGFSLNMVSHVRFVGPGFIGYTELRVLRVYCGELMLEIPTNATQAELTPVPQKCGPSSFE